MNLNELYLNAASNESEMDKLFQNIYARFRLITRNKIIDEMDAEDVIQDSMIQIKNKLGKIEPESKFTAWALKVLKYNTIDYYRKKGRRVEKLSQLMSEVEFGEQSNQNESLTKTLRECLKQVGKANIRYARILNLIYQGYEFKIICKRLTLTKNNAYSVLSRARSMLMKCMEEGVLR